MPARPRTTAAQLAGHAGRLNALAVAQERLQRQVDEEARLRLALQRQVDEEAQVRLALQGTVERVQEAVGGLGRHGASMHQCVKDLREWQDLVLLCLGVAAAGAACFAWLSQTFL